MKHASPINLHTVMKKLLIYAGLSGNGLANALNLPTPTIHRLLTGEVKDPRLSTLLLIADYFDISLEQLIGRKALPKKFKSTFIAPIKNKYSLSSDRKIIEFNSKKSKIVGVILES